MTTRRAGVFRRRAEEHRAAALRYRNDADDLLREGKRESAGALLYESAKRCINAIANQQGSNPVRTAAKFQFLRSLAAQGHTAFDLLRGWHSASSLHSHADQGHLTDAAFAEDWGTAQTFITEMLAHLRSGAIVNVAQIPNCLRSGVSGQPPDCQADCPLHRYRVCCTGREWHSAGCGIIRLGGMQL